MDLKFELHCAVYAMVADAGECWRFSKFKHLSPLGRGGGIGVVLQLN